MTCELKFMFSGVLPLVLSTLHVAVIGITGAFAVIAGQFIIFWLFCESVIFTVGLYVPVLYTCVVELGLLLVVPSPSVHVYVYCPVPPLTCVFSCTFSGDVPVVGVALHVAIIGVIGVFTIMFPQFAVFVCPFESVIFSVVVYVFAVVYVCVAVF